MSNPISRTGRDSGVEFEQRVVENGRLLAQASVESCFPFAGELPLLFGCFDWLVVQGHCCPVKSRTESVGWNVQLADLCSPSAEVPVEWAFSRTE